jgi:hypothetical protein
MAWDGRMELDSCAREKRARQKFSEISAPRSKINCHSSPDDDRRNKDLRKHDLSLIRFIMLLTLFLVSKGLGK